MTIPLLDLKAQYAAIRDEIDQAVAQVFESQYFILGPSVEACEKALAAYCGGEHACGVSSGTDALLIALMAEEIGPGDEVITTPYTFFATAGCIARVGATPVFVDIDPVTYNLDTGQLKAKITGRTRAVIPVHLYGQMADMDGVMQLAKQHDLVVIEDAAQAIGAESRKRRAGSLGHYGCFSFFPSKNLGGAGDGGMVVTRDAERAQKLQDLRNHGMRPKYHHDLIGGNFRLDALQAAVISVKLKYLEDWNTARRTNAERYDHLFREAGLAPDTSSATHLDVEHWTFDVGCSPDTPTRSCPVRTPYPGNTGDRHVWNQYVIRVPKRDALRAALAEQGIGHEVYYPVPLHRQPCFSGLGYKEGTMPHSETAAEETLALPVYPELSDQQAGDVVAAIGSFLT